MKESSSIWFCKSKNRTISFEVPTLYPTLGFAKNKCNFLKRKYNEDFMMTNEVFETVYDTSWNVTYAD